jgi:hypothetical protein
MNLLKIERLETVLQSRWAEFLDNVQVMRLVLEHVRDTPFQTLTQQEIPTRHTKMSITHFRLDHRGEFPFFEVWVEFTVPKGDGVVIGTAIFELRLSGSFDLRQCLGSHFVAQKS